MTEIPSFIDEEIGGSDMQSDPVSDKACWGLSSGFLDAEPGPLSHATCNLPTFLPAPKWQHSAEPETMWLETHPGQIVKAETGRSTRLAGARIPELEGARAQSQGRETKSHAPEGRARGACEAKVLVLKGRRELAVGEG